MATTQAILGPFSVTPPISVYPCYFKNIVAHYWFISASIILCMILMRTLYNSDLQISEWLPRSLKSCLFLCIIHSIWIIKGSYHLTQRFFLDLSGLVWQIIKYHYDILWNFELSSKFSEGPCNTLSGEKIEYWHQVRCILLRGSH